MFIVRWPFLHHLRLVVIVLCSTGVFKTKQITLPFSNTDSFTQSWNNLLKSLFQGVDPLYCTNWDVKSQTLHIKNCNTNMKNWFKCYIYILILSTKTVMEYLPIFNPDKIFKAKQQKSPVRWHPCATLPSFWFVKAAVGLEGSFWIVLHHCNCTHENIPIRIMWE